MGCQEMKEKKKEPLKKEKEPLKEIKDINSEGQNEQKPLEEQNIIEIEHQNSPKNQVEPLLNKNQEPIIKEDEKIESILELDSAPYIPNYIGKLCFDPFDLFIYDLKKRVFHVQKYRYENNSNFENLNSSSSCCNGDNKLFISGGIDNFENIIEKLWIFDLINYRVECLDNFAPKNNHSMIYIPSKYIFLVGGNDKKVFYFDINEKKRESWGELNKNRIEPALIQMNNYLYVFDNVNKNEDNFELNFERTDLLSDKPNFELIEPKLSSNIGGNIIPKFFGVAKESEDSIIFLGGNILDEQNDYNDIKNYRYNINDNLIEFSEVPFINIQLIEKTLLNYNNKNDIYIHLSDFYRRCPQIIFYIKNKNQIKVVDYKPQISPKKIQKQEVNNILIDGENLNQKMRQHNFNMPKNKENINDNILNYD